MVIHTERRVRKTVGSQPLRSGSWVAFGNLLRKEHGGGKVVPKPKNLRDCVVPVEILGIYFEQVSAGERPPWGV